MPLEMVVAVIYIREGFLGIGNFFSTFFAVERHSESEHGWIVDT